ncbi:MAG: hypothetical protein JWO02_2275, partial [Solirubrobacterales bacterium]|nr:hypothetical protein [Solirubrobacterales bacterium]
MTDPASAADLDRELQRQTAALQGSVAAAQERAFRAETAEHQAHAVVADRDAELVAVREQLALARRELHWLRRAGIDLNRVMDHPALRAGRL